VGVGSVAERLDHDLVVAARQALQGAPRLGAALAGEVAADRHGRTGYALPRTAAREL
jgi:hypothetical protein